MKRIARLLSGTCVGGALLSVGLAATPASASAAFGGFCEETANYICCCSTNGDGSINDCSCMRKGPVEPT